MILPRISLKNLLRQNASYELDGNADINSAAKLIFGLLEKHSFVILTDLEENMTTAHDLFTAEFTDFLQDTSAEVKKECVGPIYCNQRQIPLWFVGYEKQKARESFRMPTQKYNPASGHNYIDNTKWPNEKFKQAHQELANHMKEVTDFLFHLFLSTGRAKTDGTNKTNIDAAAAVAAADAGALSNTSTSEYDFDASLLRLSDKFTDSVAEDLSVFHSFNYPNTYEDGFRPELPGILLKEHKDQSLFVAEFAPKVSGLQVYDLYSEQYILVEDLCDYGKELIVFAGQGIEDLILGINTPYKIHACKHRVIENLNHSRMCFLFEQKYKSYLSLGTSFVRQRNEKLQKEQEQGQEYKTEEEKVYVDNHSTSMDAYYRQLMAACDEDESSSDDNLQCHDDNDNSSRLL